MEAGRCRGSVAYEKEEEEFGSASCAAWVSLREACRGRNGGSLKCVQRLERAREGDAPGNGTERPSSSAERPELKGRRHLVHHREHHSFILIAIFSTKRI